MLMNAVEFGYAPGAMAQPYDTTHGSPYDRGSADAYYGRASDPHYYIGGSVVGIRCTCETEEELEAYKAGYAWQIMYGDKKEW
jgi:hypothetical protein